MNGTAAPTMAGSAVEMLLSLIVVLALMFAMVWLLKRVQRVRGGVAGAMQIHAGLSLGGKERVVLVEAGGKHFLLGVSASGVNLIYSYEQAPVLPQREPLPMPPLAKAFSSWLDEAMKKAPK